MADYFNWWAFQKGLLHQLALKAIKKMSKIINEIHGRKFQPIEWT